MNPAERSIELLVGYPINWDSTAGWAQFAGAMIAVVLALQQSFLAGRREKARDRAAARAAYTLVHNASQVVTHMRGELLVTPIASQALVAERMLGDRRLDLVEAAILAFDTTRLPDEVFVTGVDQAQTAMREFRQALEAIVRPPRVMIVVTAQRAAEKMQMAADTMVPTLVLFGKGAKFRAIRQRVAGVWLRFLPRPVHRNGA